ncbi:MAG: universal stress protein [Rhodocyclaceae bacterium]|jgi:nucleotide-binding universal stress UspA family protein|nr:universal stress protein [Rhodocyclaceae bacterium]MDP2108636.1 universal stress protein [Rhodocyclaceae bacterium]MDP2196440.1 universal stress protein [Rhodocyclaceae bacterium]
MKTFLVASDGSTAAEKAVDFAANRAKQEQARLVIVNVSEPFCPVGISELDVSVFDDAMKKESAAILEAALARAKAAGVTATTVHEIGAPAEAIIAIAKRESAGEIFVASHGRHGLARVAIGSISSRVVEWAPCTVTVVK